MKKLVRRIDTMETTIEAFKTCSCSASCGGTSTGLKNYELNTVNRKYATK